MSEEKKAIDNFKKLDFYKWNITDDDVVKILNLVEKQQKEIEALEIIHNTYKEMIEENNYISKDKIKERKKWYEDTCEHLSKNGIDLDKYEQYQGAIELCEELLEEN